MIRKSTVDASVSPAQRHGLRELLEDPRFEVLPLGRIVDDAVAHLPAGAKVTVTASPTRGADPTVETAEALIRKGFRAVPHLAATQHGEDSLPHTLERLQTAGVQEVFVVGGDAADGQARRGKTTAMRDAPFSDGQKLLAAVRRLAPELRLGVAGYPEGHPKISQETLDESLAQKAEWACCLVTQLCFDPQTVHEWATGLRARGVQTPVYAGVPGSVGSARLMRVAGRIGIGDSLRFLASGRAGLALRLASPGRYDPTSLVAGLVTASGDVVVSGIHLYTFNALEETELWRRRLVAWLEEGDHG
ncbi:methylenetetrahydrofolate reductase [Nesterenkonia haasae]|uniref:methylenetetrahydrofolate reductase n=1 Tax=Nesterenkonia haasae TaxID=2587813 RepID=UPI0013920619|nr:methylenetetrahydrofolate reductase [Nesterenkonia haasae]NDK32914.1 methylenetetrahydrofolate reductase [Nesterenkonia haasae]